MWMSSGAVLPRAPSGGPGGRPRGSCRWSSGRASAPPASRRASGWRTSTSPQPSASSTRRRASAAAGRAPARTVDAERRNGHASKADGPQNDPVHRRRRVDPPVVDPLLSSINAAATDGCEPGTMNSVATPEPTAVPARARVGGGRRRTSIGSRYRAAEWTFTASGHELADDLGRRAHVVDPRHGLAGIEGAGLEQRAGAVVGGRAGRQQRLRGAGEQGDAERAAPPGVRDRTGMTRWRRSTQPGRPPPAPSQRSVAARWAAPGRGQRAEERGQQGLASASARRL